MSSDAPWGGIYVEDFTIFLAGHLPTPHSPIPTPPPTSTDTSPINWQKNTHCPPPGRIHGTPLILPTPFPSTSNSYNLVVGCYLFMQSTWTIYFKIFQLKCVIYISLLHTLCVYFPFQSLSILVTQFVFIKHFNKTTALLWSYTFSPRFLPMNISGTVTLPYKDFFYSNFKHLSLHFFS